ncbi:MAG: ABC transporter substrate-binding protein [Chloroflexi bacterium]|nr:ABC transporter substrate-binding protein [Chloroflexota bacterium]
MRTLRQKHVWLLGLVGVVGFLVTACGGAEEPTPTPTAAPRQPTATPAVTARPTAAPAPTPTVAPAATPTPVRTPTSAPTATSAAPSKPTGQVRIALGDLSEETFDPGPGSTFRGTYLYPLFDSIVGATPNGRLSAPDGLAREWSVSADNKAWTFRLRDGIRWHDGTEITADDLKFTMDRYSQPLVRPRLSYPVIVQGLDGVTVKDKYTAEVRYTQPFPWLPYYFSGLLANLGMIVPKAYFERVDLQGFNAKPIGSGAYKFDEQFFGSFIRLKAVDNHWRVGVPKYETMTFIKGPELSTRIAMLKVGQAEVASIDRQSSVDLRQQGLGILVKDGDPLLTGWMIGQFKDGPLSDKRVREALNLAVNRQEIIDGILFGGAKASVTYPVGSRSIAAMTVPPYPYDLARARQLIEAAGFKGTTVRQWSFVQQALPELPLVSTALASMWADTGLKIELATMEYASWRLNVWRKGEQGLAAFPQGLAFFPISSFDSLYSGRGAATFVKDATLTRLTDEAIAALTVEAHVAKLQEAQRYIRDNHMAIPIAEVSTLYAARKGFPSWDVDTALKVSMNLEAMYKR